MAESYPDAPGHRGVDTSIEAANAIAGITARVRRMTGRAIYGEFSRGLTAEEAANRLCLSRATVQPRTSELRKMGLIRDSGQRRFNSSGRRAIVWVAVGVTA